VCLHLYACDLLVTVLYSTISDTTLRKGFLRWIPQWILHKYDYLQCT